MSVIGHLAAWDRDAFLALNGLHTPFTDALWSATSRMELWFPLYLFLLYALQRRFGWKGLGIAVPVIAVMILCSDTGSVALFKNTVQRLRPCHEPALAALVHTVDGRCGGQYGFVSSHASNHFAIAAFMIGAMKGWPRWAGHALFLWAALIALGRVFLGVHYPGDILVGAYFGLTVGSIFALIFRHFAVRHEVAQLPSP